MAIFKICVRNKNRNGVWPVYIRITHRMTVTYIRTTWVVDDAGLDRHKEVRDAMVLENCSKNVSEYVGRLNGLDISDWDAGKLRDYLCAKRGNMTFSAFAKRFIDRMEAEGGTNNSKLYQAALTSMQNYFCSDSVRFDEIVRDRIEAWLDTLAGTRRAKTLYARCMRKVFENAMMRSTEPDSGLPAIRYNPWGRVEIPSSRPANKRAISVEECRKFFAYPEYEGLSYRERMGCDVALLSFCLAGMNTVDLYNLRSDSLKDGVVRYNRSKTCTRRSDGAYFEIQANEMALALIEKYRSKVKNSEYLFCFKQRYIDARSFNAVANWGIKHFCERLGISERNRYTVYTFRHTWATIARNVCGASLSEVGFAMNHIQGDSVTRGYIKPDFTPAWRLNERVQGAVFGKEEQQKAPEDKLQLSKKVMVYARAYCRGELLAEVSDIGFESVDAIIGRLVPMLPDTLSTEHAVHFRIKNVDAEAEAVYSRMKGKDF